MTRQRKPVTTSACPGPIPELEKPIRRPQGKWRLKRTVQCAKCPWRKDVNPHDIPNGYDPKKHEALARTIAKPGDLSSLRSNELRIMACHETHDAHCIGWLVNQMGPGNNIALRLALMDCENMREVKTCGEQHERFEDTLPDEY